MKTYYKEIKIVTSKQFEIVDITNMVLEVLREYNIQEGLLALQSPHSTASIRLNNYEPLLLQDMFKAMYRLVPVDLNYSHDIFELRTNVMPGERTNGHAHIKAFLLGSSETVIIQDGKLMLGQYQNILFIEFDGGRNRVVQLRFMGN